MLTGIVLLVVLIALAREVAPPAATIVGGLVALVLVGVVPPEVALGGLASPATIAIAGLFVMTRALREHGRIERAVMGLLGDGARGERRALLRLLPPLALLSGMMNNVPLVVTTAPMVRDWAQRRGLATTRLLIPVSFVVILGGLVTLIGTGPTLIVSSALAATGAPAFGFLTVTPVGLPLAIVGGTLVVLLGPRLLPDRRDAWERGDADLRTYTVPMSIAPGGPCDGRTIAEAGLRDLPSTFVAAVVRDGLELPAVGPETRLEGGDDLVLVGGRDDVAALLAHPGLVSAEEAQVELLDGDGHGLVECVLSSGSPLVGTTLKALSFRGRYGGVVVAVRRAGERLSGRLGRIALRPGDVLLVLAGPGFVERWATEPDFGSVVELDGSTARPADRRTWITLAAFATMVVVVASGAVPIATAVLGACAVLVATRTIGFRQALDAVDRDIVLIVAGSLGLATALGSSGLVGAAADVVLRLALGLGPLAALAVLTLATMALTETIANTAAAALMTPLAVELALRTGADPTGFAVAVAVAASASFLTPIGYATNTIVYGLGRYRFGDFWRLGLPLSLTVVTTVLLVVPRVWG